MDTYGCLRVFAKTHLVKHFWRSGIRHRGAYQKDEFTTGPAGRMETPETGNRIYWGSHMQHIYTVQVGSLAHSKQEVSQSSRNRTETRTESNETSKSPNPGWKCCQDPTAETGWGLQYVSKKHLVGGGQNSLRILFTVSRHQRKCRGFVQDGVDQAKDTQMHASRQKSPLPPYV